MSKHKCLQDIAISHFKDGKKAPTIAKLLANKVSRSTVSRWNKDYQNPKRVSQKPSVGRPRIVRTKRLVHFVKKRLESASNRKSSRNMAKDFNVSHFTVLKVLHDDLAFKPWRKIRVPKLSENHIAQRLSCSRWMRKKVKKETTTKMMWVDEKIFTRNGYFNPQNDIIWAKDRESANQHGGLLEKEKYPESVMIAMGITWNGLTKPYFFDKGLRLTTKKYIDVLEFYKCEGDRLFNSTDWGFVQDGASAHTSNESLEWCQNRFEWYVDKFHWPANTPEWNPMDYSVWTEIERHIDYTKVKSRGDLIKEITKAAKRIDVNFCREVIGDFLKRIYATEKNNGNLIVNMFR